jgi:hypothetical protein
LLFSRNLRIWDQDGEGILKRNPKEESLILSLPVAEPTVKERLVV